MKNLNPEMLKAIAKALNSIIVLMSLWVFSLIAFAVFSIYWINKKPETLQAQATENTKPAEPEKPKVNYWTAPAEASLDGDTKKELVLYGRELIANTALYFGPKGRVKAMTTNGMNCQNCHLDAGTKVFGNNYASVASTYPKYRARSGATENIYKRVNDCFERSLNGKALDTNSREMQAITAYIQWLGKDVPKGKKAEGSGFQDIAFLERPADPVLGKVAYEQKCVVCHGKDGQGQMRPDGVAYIYPPLWGSHSYNSGAGLYRMSNFAKYIKANMPLGASFEKPQLSDEESWDIAAYVNSLERPTKDLSRDWPKMEEKPFDHPFGPFADGFTTDQHKFGPFKPIIAAKKKQEEAKKAAKS